MPYCQKCRIIYDPGNAVCRHCGSDLIPDTTRPQAQPDKPVTTSSGIAAGLLGAGFNWGALVLLSILAGCLPESPSDGFSAARLCVLPVTGGIAGFAAGSIVKAAGFMSGLIGWLLISVPVFCLVALGYAHDGSPPPVAQGHLIWCAIFSPLLVGPLASVAAVRFGRTRKLESLMLLLIPTGLTILALLIAGAIVGKEA